MATYKTPGTYIEEVPGFPPSVASVETAIPVFIGYTQKAQQVNPGDLHFVPKRIKSLLEYELLFGKAKPERSIEVLVNTTPGNIKATATINTVSPYLMSYSLELFFVNGGGPCYIVSCGDYAENNLIDKAILETGLNAIKTTDEITLIVFPDAINLRGADLYYSLHKKALEQCAELLDRFTIMDVWIDADKMIDNIGALRIADLGDISHLKYGAAYYPRINATIDYVYEEAAVTIVAVGDASLAGTLAQLKQKNNACYYQAKDAIKQLLMVLPVAPAAAGLYAQVDSTRGVWKSPANININAVTSPVLLLNDAQQDKLNVDLTGRSINAVRNFPGRGPAMLWGARTLAGNDNEWRYISVRRFFNMVEESVKKSTEPFVFEPNDANTWVRVKSMIYNFLTLQWRAGALAGDRANNAFFVHVGLGETMTAIDIAEGKMIVEIGMAVIRPAEFIILRFMHKMLSAT